MDNLEINKKIALKPDEIIMKFVQARMVNGEYLCFYNITILTREQRMNPSYVLLMSNVDSNSYKIAIESNIPAEDRKFLSIKKIDSFGVILKFEIEKWIDSAFNSVSPKVEQIGFKKTYKSRIRPPRVMAYDVFMKQWQDAICKEFSNWIIKNHKESSLIEKILPEDLKKKVKNNINDLFDFAFDINNNSIIVTLKPIWVMSVMYAASQFGDKKISDINNLDVSKNRNFFVNVDREIKKFSDGKFSDFVSKKNLKSKTK